MRRTMTVNWRCSKCGTKGKLVYEVPVTRQQAYADVMKAHQLPISKIEQPDVFMHMQAVYFTVRRTGAASTQQPLFE